MEGGAADTDRRDFSGVRLDDADFSGARLHSPNCERLKVTDGWLVNADISGYIEGMRVNGVEVGPLVSAELDRRFPQRVKLRATDPAGLADAWTMLEEVWRQTIARARLLPEARLHERVDQEWSFLETLRHLILATDSWLGRMILQLERPYHPWGVAGSWLTDPRELGLDPDAAPSFDQVLPVWRGRADSVQEAIASVTADELERLLTPPAAPGHPDHPESMLHCLHVILDEYWLHSTYANRDLAILEGHRG